MKTAYSDFCNSDFVENSDFETPNKLKKEFVNIQKSNLQKIQNHFVIRNYYSNFLKLHITILQVYFSDGTGNPLLPISPCFFTSSLFLTHRDVPPGITSESRGDVTCDSLGDVTWSHGTHDVKRSVGKVRRIWMRKQHQEGQNRIVISTRVFLLRSNPHSHVYEGVFTTVVSNK